MIFSLVATESMAPSGLRFFDRDENLWNVPITRAKVLMLVIGDRAFWEDHGALGGKLAARIDADLEQAARWRRSDDMRGSSTLQTKSSPPPSGDRKTWLDDHAN